MHDKPLRAQAERCRMILGREELVPRATVEEDGAAAVPPELAERVAAIELQGNFMFDPVRSPCAACWCRIMNLSSSGADCVPRGTQAIHRDFLGACLGTGLERTKVGDIIVQA